MNRNAFMSYKDIQTLLLATFPEIQPSFQTAFGTYYDLKTEVPGAYPIFEDVLRPFLFDLLDFGGNDSLLPRIFDFLEAMANSPERDVIDLLGIAIVEPIVFRPNLLKQAWRYMGVKTRELARETAQVRGWLKNIPADENVSTDNS